METGIGEMVDQFEIDQMNSFIKRYGREAFICAVWNGAFSEHWLAYIHPADELKASEGFKDIQWAFINAYC